MPSNTENQKSKFITTEPIGFAGEAGEQQVWDAVRAAFAERECICFWLYPIFSKDKQFCWEPDILIVDRELGLIVIELPVPIGTGF
ncbi:hypothetical protein [Coleofasciculus sp. H7-2]|uniref:hypothetical protein n=1 Tax=Coleofasciculus sp. H7-2 TaxID=3351545 RepID=UPI00366F3400